MTGDLVNTLHHSATQALHSKSADACTTTHCNTPHTATQGGLDMTGDLINTLRHSATQALHSNRLTPALQHTASHCNML